MLSILIQMLIGSDDDEPESEERSDNEGGPAVFSSAVRGFKNYFVSTLTTVLDHSVGAPPCRSPASASCPAEV
jgi:hypothetical protein